jgi:hypothetical protein
LARALAFQAGGRGFESRLPLHFYFSTRAPVAQGIEQLPSKQWVAGSIPARRASIQAGFGVFFGALHFGLTSKLTAKDRPFYPPRQYAYHLKHGLKLGSGVYI